MYFMFREIMDSSELKAPELYINRELSLLAFNRRVLEQAKDENTPLLERLRFLCISSSNLDEFFEIRVAGLIQKVAMSSVQAGPDNMLPGEVLGQISTQAHELVDEQYRVLNDVLLPALEKARNQAYTIKCQSNLRQWSVVWTNYLDDNESCFSSTRDALPDDHPGWWRDYYLRPENEGIRLCPMATELVDPEGDLLPYDFGSRFLAWGRLGPIGTIGYDLYGSYGVNWWLFFHDSHYPYPDLHQYCWETTDARSPAKVPVWFDCTFFYADAGRNPSLVLYPPPLEDFSPGDYQITYCVVNRHDGGMNYLFMDWSVRKVGLKEPWILKWQREFDTANKWTLAGGVQPEDWPEWMRKFKDY